MKSRLPPVAWPTVPLSSVAEIHTGVAKGTKPIKDPVELPYLRVANVQAGMLDLSVVKVISIERTDVRRYSLCRGDVLLTEGGDFDKLGRGTIWNGEVEVCLHQNHVFAVRCDTTKVLPEWLSTLAGSFYGRRYFMLCSKQSTNLASINSTQLKAFPLPLPTLIQQMKIVETLEAIEKQLLQITELIEAKRTFKRGLVGELLNGRKRFPAFRNLPWQCSRLGDHVQAVTRRNAESEVLVLTASGEHGLVDQRRYFSRNVAGVDLSKYWLIKKGEFAYNRSAMNGYPYGATKRLDQHEQGLLSVLYLCFSITDSALDSDYLKQVFDGRFLDRQLRPIVRVGARSHGLLNVTDEDYLSINIPLPSPDEQRAIAGILGSLDREIDLLAAKGVQIEVSKRALLSRLLSGDLTIPP